MKRFRHAGWAALAIIPALFVTLAVTHPASAQGIQQPQATGTPRTACGKNVQCVQSIGDALIAKRIASLNAFIARINAHQRLTSDQKTALVGDAQTNITNLQAQQKLLDGETTIDAARTDVKNIFVNFRIYAVVLPRDEGEAYLDVLATIQSKFSSNESKISQAIQNAANKGINVTQEQQQFSDLQAKVTDAATQISNAQGLIPSLTPANYPGTTATLVQYRADHKAARVDLTAAAKDLKSIVTELKAAGAGATTTTPTPSA